MKDVSLNVTSDDSFCIITDICTITNGNIISDGEQDDVKCSCTGTLPGSGSKFKGKVTITYTLGSSSFTHTKEGKLVAPVEETAAP